MDYPLTCDIFCRVIDNHGDIGVCWRLARQLHVEHGWQVRLWLDEPPALAPLASDTSGVEVQAWRKDFPDITPAQVVIEAFACELPESYLAAMTALDEKPVWINLEYLCVEPWGASVHRKPSPHPRLPLIKHFFVPGIHAGSGGLLREKDLQIRRADFIRPQQAPALEILLFCYANPVLPTLLELWSAGPRSIRCRVAAGLASREVGAWLGQPFEPGLSAVRGSLRLDALPFVPQHSFDELLWASDLNFVRGEDSFARAQWAAQPLVWQIYPQEEQAHHAKLRAFLDTYTDGLPADPRGAYIDFNAWWNELRTLSTEGAGKVWRSLCGHLPALSGHAGPWASRLDSLGDLAGNLAKFCKDLKAKSAEAG